MNVEQLKKAKKEQKMTYEQLSEKSGVPLSTIYDLFRGITAAPRIDTVQAIQEALGISKPLEWTEEDRALGVGKHHTPLTEDEWKWQELRSELIRVHGEKYYQTVFTMVEALLHIDKK